MSLDNIPPTSPLWNLGLDYRPPSSEDADSVSPSSSEFMFENFHTATIDLPGRQFPLLTSAGPSTYPMITVPISHLRQPSAHTESGGDDHSSDLLRRSNSIPHLAPANIVTNNLPHTPTSQLAEIPATRNKVSDPPESSSVRPHAPPQRLSVLRQGGTASVLDLASLVRSTRDRAQESMEFIGSPPVFNYHPTTSSFDQPPVQPSLNDSAAEQTTNNARNASIETNTPHQTPVRRRLISRLGGVPECGLPLQSGTSYQTPSSTAPSLLSSPCAQPHNLDHKRSLVKATHGRQQIEPRLSSSSPSPNEDGSTRQSPTSDLGRRPHTEEVQVPSSCLPISMEGRRSMGSPKECRSRRSKSQSDSIDGLQERDSFEKVHEPYVVENDDEACTSMSSDAPPEAPARLRSLSGPAPSRPVHPAAAFTKPLQIWGSSMRKRSAFFRRKPSASQSQAADPTCEEASPPPQLSCSPPPSEPRTLRQPFNSEPSHRHHHHNHYQKRTPVDAPPVPIVPLSYHQNSSAQSINPPPSSMPPSPLKTRLPSPSSSSTRPGHSLDPQDPTLGVSTSTHPRWSHSPALSPPKHFPMSSPSPTSSQPPKSSWLLSTSPRAFSERPDHPLILRGAQTRSPSSINLSLSSLSNGRSTLPSLESRPSKTRPMLSAATFSGSRPSTPLEADDSQLASQPPLSSSLALKSPSPTHRTAHFPTPGLSEEDQLRLSLQLWNLDQDGILRPPSADSPTTPKASLDIDTLSSSGSISSFFSASSDPNDLSVHAQDAAIPERVLYTHILRSPPAVKKYNLTKNPTENSTFSASHCLPSLVNPNRTTMQPRYPAELFDRPLNTLTRIKALDSPDGTILLPSSSQLFTSPPHLSSKHSSSSDHSTAKLTCGSTSPPNSSTVGSSSPQPTVVSRANSMKECRDPSSAEQVTATLVDKFRRRGYTHNDSASASKLLESHPPAPSRVPNIPPSISAQLDDTSCATHSESASCMVDPLPGTETEDSGTDDLPSHLPPSIRFVSSTSRTNSGEQDSPKSLVTAVSPLKSSTGSARSSPLNRGDLSQSSRSSGNTSATVRAHHHSQVSKPSHAFRCNPGLGIKPTVESDRPLAPQLHRRDLDHAPPPKHGAIMEDHRTPRNHQSSPNLRNPRPSTPPDTSFFSVIVSGPQLPQDGSVVAERQSLVAHSSHLHPLSSPSSSSNPEGPSDPADRRSSLVIPGMTPEANARRLAELFWLGDESLIKRRKLTEWLGSPDTPENQLQALTRRAFMNNFDFKDLRIDLAFRKLCTKMYLKGETQQVDRILAEFSRRYWEQNQSHIYVNTDMVHALSYSILLLNTDLHVVDTTSRMSRSQFIRNTLETVYAQLSQSASALTADRSMNSFPGSSRPSLTTDPLMPNFKHPSSGSMVTRNRRTSFVDLNRTLPASGASSQSSTRSSMERWRGALINGSQPVIKTSRRSHSITSWPSDSDLRARASVGSPASVTSVTDRVDRHHSVDARRSRSSVVGRPDGHWNTAPSNPTDNVIPAPKSDRLSKALFDKEIETLLKDIYMAIKTHPIAQNPAESHSQEPAPYGSLQRIGSRRSHLTQGVGDSAGSHKRASLRGFGGFAAMLSASAEPTAVRPTSPTPSATTSVSSLPSGMMGYSSNAGSSVNLTNLTTPSIGFVSNLSQSIIREQHEEESLESSQAEDEIARDSELALLGAPWAKEGILQRKQYWESKGKRHRDRSWAEVFVVIQSGVLKMFQFGQGTTGSSAASGAGVVTSSGNEDDNSTNNNNASSNSASAVGGGNWLPNAQLLGAITLSHALTSVLVSGYSKERAHVFVLTLSNGASYFFQAGTEELVYEWVSTCNYWAARLSKEPLTGGVSNMEYGWNQLQEMDLANAGDKKEELRECQTDRDEMMSIVSGQSGHSHKGRRLRDRLFNGLPLGTPHSPSVVTHQPGHRTSDLERWSQSATSVDSQTPPASQLITDPKGTTTTTTTTSPALLPLDRHLPPSHPPSLPDKFTISDWNPPVPPMALSSLPEHVQLATLKRHNAHMQVELEKHNLLRRPMVNMYWNRPIHLQKAMVNWEKKSQYLMAEIIKYTTYLNALEATIHLKLSLPNRAASTRLNPPSSSSD